MDLLSNTPIDASASILQSSLGSSAFEHELAVKAVLNVTDTISLFINGMIPIVLAVAILSFFVYLLRYIFAKPRSGESRDAVRGASRAFIVVFLMINIWSLVRILQLIMQFSTISTFFLMLALLFLFGAWSLFSLGESLVFAVSNLFSWAMDKSEDALRNIAKSTPFENRIKKMKKDSFSLLVLIIVLSLLSFLLSILVF